METAINRKQQWCTAVEAVPGSARRPCTLGQMSVHIFLQASYMLIKSTDKVRELAPGYCSVHSTLSTLSAQALASHTMLKDTEAQVTAGNRDTALPQIVLEETSRDGNTNKTM